MNPAKEDNALNTAFPTAPDKNTAEREAGIEEMCRYLLKRRPKLRKASEPMLVHLLRLADNYHCIMYGRHIVRRHVDLPWEYYIMTEIQLWEVRKVFPRKRDGVQFKPWWTSKSAQWAVDKALLYYDMVTS